MRAGVPTSGDGMDQAVALEELVNAARNASEEVVVASAVNRFAEAIGFRWFTYLSLGGEQPEAMSTYPAVWSDHYFANRFELVDPVVHASARSGDPFTWGMSGKARPPIASAARVFDDAASFGIVCGITVPLRGPGERNALFTLSTDEACPSLLPENDRLTPLAQMAGLQLHAQLSRRFDRFKPAPRPTTLTEQQRACLFAASSGLSAKEVARQIGLSPRTVQFHYDEARRRLGAVSLPHAIALAMRRGLIA